jgi:hypothetical protein
MVVLKSSAEQASAASWCPLRNLLAGRQSPLTMMTGSLSSGGGEHRLLHFVFRQRM